MIMKKYHVLGIIGKGTYGVVYRVDVKSSRNQLVTPKTSPP